MKQFLRKGIDYHKLLEEADQLKNNDTIWASGKYFGFVYTPPKEIKNTVDKISIKFSQGNTINPILFGSLSRMEKEIILKVGELLHAPKNFAGHLTSGGTESIFLAVKAAQTRFENLFGNERVMEAIIGDTAHPAFIKACSYLKVNPIIVPHDTNYRIDTKKITEAITENTGLIVGSSPNYPYGIIDDIKSIGEIGQSHNIPVHVDACIGGLFLPFIESAKSKFDFQVKGVTSISVDLHKYGYCPKGNSIILYRDSSMRMNQYFVSSLWNAGFFGSVRLLGTTGGGPVAGAWATLKLLGKDGYKAITNTVQNSAKYLKEKINQIPGLYTVANPIGPVFTFSSISINSYELGDLLEEKGWYLERFSNPECLGIILTIENISKVDEFLIDLILCVEELRKKNSNYKNHQKWASIMYHTLPEKVTDKLLSLMVKKDSISRNRSIYKRFLYGLNNEKENTKKLNHTILELLDKIHQIN